MIIQTIINEADILVPNEVSLADKISALNGFHQDFFNVVKIPEVTIFNSVVNQSSYALGLGVWQKNVHLVQCGVVKYKELNENTTNPLQNTYFFDDSTHTVHLLPAPYQTGLTGFVRYYRRTSNSFGTSNLGAIPDFPEEYHWTLVVALASYIANTQDDAVKASNYENQYKSAWNVAAQEYAKEVTT